MAAAATPQHRSRMLLSLALSAALAAPAAAQRKRAPEVSGWNPPKLEIASEIPGAAARTEVRRQVDGLIGVLKGTSALAAPAFPIYTAVQASFVDPPAPYPVQVSMVFYRPGMVGTAADDQVRFEVNDPSRLWDTERAQSVHTFGERELYFEPRFDRTWHGYPMNGRDYIIVARAGRELFRPVSVQAYLGLMLADLRAKARDDESGTYAGMLQKIQARYAALSPAQRAAPAYGCLDGFDEDTYLCDATTDGARRLVEFNPAYWDRSLPRTAFQLLVLYRFNPEKKDGPVGEALSAAWDGLDWSAWRHLLGDRPSR